MCPQAPRLSPEYSHKAGLQTVITGRPLQIRLVMRSGHAGPIAMGRITRGPPCWTRPRGETTSSQVFVRRRVGRRVSLSVVLSPLVQRGWRRHRAKGGVFAFALTIGSIGTLIGTGVPDLPSGEDNYRFGGDVTETIRLPINTTRTPQSQHHFSSGYQPCVARLTSL
jgi:hypothetical protein